MAVSAKPAWAAPLAICCLAMTLFLIAATIVLALIPVYLPIKDIDGNITTQDEMLYAGYASDVNDGTLLTLSNTNSLSTQLTNNAGLSSNNVNLQSGSFASVTPANRRKRQNSQKPTCERATGLTGNIFIAPFRIKYPSLCNRKICRAAYKLKVQNGLRRNYQRDTVSMTLNSTSRSVQLAFCSFYSSDPTNSSGGCTTETKNYIYLFDVQNMLYQFNPTTLNITTIGLVNCTSSNVYAISLQRNGYLWGIDYRGNLFKYSISSRECISINYISNQSNFSVFTMAFIKTDLVNDEALYVNRVYPYGNQLGKIDLTTLTLSYVANFTNTSIADLTSTSDGRLFALIGNGNYTAVEIDKTTAQITATYPLGIETPIYATYGFSSYNSNLLLFSGNDSNSTDLYLFNPSTNSATVLANYPYNIIGAAVSSCLGTS